MSEWKEIETAPRDWTDIMAYVPDLCDAREVCEAYFDTEVKRWKAPAFGIIKPTHWKPLPSPPQPTKGITQDEQ